MEGAPTNYDAMDFSELEADAVAGPVLQEMALNHLKETQPEYFDREFTGELDPEGYLYLKSGSYPITRPSQNISADVNIVAEMTRAALKKRGL